jgi:hypothetical protein
VPLCSSVFGVKVHVSLVAVGGVSAEQLHIAGCCHVKPTVGGELGLSYASIALYVLAGAGCLRAGVNA